MKVRQHSSAAEYLDVVGATLRRKPVLNQLAIGIAQHCIREPERYGPNVLFFSVEDGGNVIGAALQTPPWHVQLSVMVPEAARVLGRAFAALPTAISGVMGHDEASNAFGEEYAEQRGQRLELAQSMGTFELTAVNAVRSAPGRRVLAASEHAAVLQTWLEAFQAEALPHDPPMRADAGTRAVGTGRGHVWLDENNVPVSYAFNSRDVDGWASVGPVYTPDAARGRGFATALVASLSQYLLDEGRPGCTLFTNLANPTSNAIYERIGYRRIGTAYQYVFR